MFGNVQQNFDEELVKYEERKKVIDELIDWSKWRAFDASDLNVYREKGFTHREATIYSDGCCDFSEWLRNKLNKMRGEYKTSGGEE